MEIMTKGHLAVAKELGLKISRGTAKAITEHDLKNSSYKYDMYGSYVVYKKSTSITGTIYILTKLYVPKEHRGKGHARRLLNSCPTPLVTCEKDGLKVVRDGK